MRMGTIGLALGVAIAAATASYASTPAAIGDDPVNIRSTAEGLYGATNAADEIVIARRDRGNDDSNGDDHGRHHGDKGKDKGDKSRGGNDDGPNHDRNDDHGDHGPNHT
jgi:hypothetical protein